MAAENYWRYADARQQQQQAMVAAAAAAAGMAPAQPVNPAQSVAAAAAMNPQAAAMAQQAAAPPLKRPRPDFGDVSAGQDMTGYYPRETGAGYNPLRENEAFGSSYDRYLRNGVQKAGT